MSRPGTHWNDNPRDMRGGGGGGELGFPTRQPQPSAPPPPPNSPAGPFSGREWPIGMVAPKVYYQASDIPVSISGTLPCTYPPNGLM